MDNNKMVPEIRFPGFVDPWEQRKLGDEFERVNERNNGQFGITHWISVAKMYYQEPDKVQSNNLDTRTYVMRKGDIAFEGHANSEFKFGRFVANDIGDGIISELFPIYRHKTPYINSYWKYAIQIERVMSPIYAKSITSSGASSNKLNEEHFLRESILVPNLKEQKAIGTFLTSLDNLITLHQRKLYEIKDYKKGMLQKMFPQNGELFPKIRFPEFTDPWEQRKLESLCDVFTDGDWIEAKDQSNSGIRLVQTGNVGTTEYLDKENNKKWISEETFERLHCKEIYAGDILISRLPEPAGRACILPELGNRMITAVDCTIVRTSKECDSKYLVQYLSTPMYFNVVNSFLGGGTRQRISRGNLSAIDIPIPLNIEEQKKIGKYLGNFDNLIALHQRKLDEMRELKKGLLQKMFI